MGNSGWSLHLQIQCKPNNFVISLELDSSYRYWCICREHSTWLRFDDLKPLSLKMTESLRVFLHKNLHGYYFYFPLPRHCLGSLSICFINGRGNWKCIEDSCNHYYCFKFRICSFQTAVRYSSRQAKTIFYPPGKLATTDEKLSRWMESLVFSHT